MTRETVIMMTRKIAGTITMTKKTTATPTEAADMIRGAGGKVVLAHPVAYTYEAGLSDGQIVKLAKEMKAFGIL